MGRRWSGSGGGLEMTLYPKRLPLSNKQIEKRFHEQAWLYSEQYSELCRPYRVFLHDDGKAILQLATGRGYLIETKDDFNLLVETYESVRRRSRQHILEGKFPYGVDFPEKAMNIALALPDFLPINRDYLTFEMSSLQAIDHAIHTIGRSKCLEHPIFVSLVAYVGEVMRKSVNGHWNMRVSTFHTEIWEPWIVDRQDRWCNPFIPLYDLLSGEPGTLYGYINSAIENRHKLRRV